MTTTTTTTWTISWDVRGHRPSPSLLQAELHARSAFAGLALGQKYPFRDDLRIAEHRGLHRLGPGAGEPIALGLRRCKALAQRLFEKSVLALFGSMSGDSGIGNWGMAPICC